MGQKTEPGPNKWEYFETLRRYDGFDWDNPNTVSFFVDETTNPDGRYVMIKSQSKEFDLDGVHPYKLQKFLERYFPGYVELVKLRQGGLMLKTKTAKQALDAIKSLDEIPDHGKISVSSVKNLNEVRGVIYGKELLCLTDEELKAAMSEYNVVSIRRMNRTVNGESISSGSFVLTFDLKTLPKDIKVVNFSYRVRAFVPGPYQCFKCLSFGHPTQRCTSTVEYCFKCGAEKGENHVCGEKQCKNCPPERNNHSPTSSDCPEYLFEKVVQRKRTQQKISYSKAKSDLLRLCESSSHKDKESYAAVSSSQEREISMKIAHIDSKIATQTIMNKTLEDKLAKYDELIAYYKDLIKKTEERKQELLELERSVVEKGIMSIEQTKHLREINEIIECDDEFTDDDDIFDKDVEDMETEHDQNFECIGNSPTTAGKAVKRLKTGNTALSHHSVPTAGPSMQLLKEDKGRFPHISTEDEDAMTGSRVDGNLRLGDY